MYVISLLDCGCLFVGVGVWGFGGSGAWVELAQEEREVGSQRSCKL